MPLIDFLFLPAIFAVLVLGTHGIPSDYMTGRDICPSVHTVRRQLYWLDSGLLYLFKDSFAWGCNLEDGYFRLIFDTWVRGIATDSDNMLLLASAVLRSLFFHAVVIKYLILPVMVVLNVIASSTVYLVSQFFSHLVPQVHLPPQLLHKLHEANDLCHHYIDVCNFNTMGGFICSLPPPTTCRVRPRTDYVDSFDYWWERQFRMFEYFYSAAQQRLYVLTTAVPLLAVGTRILCMTTHIDWYLRILFFMPGDVSLTTVSLPIDALGHTIDKVARLVLERVVPVTVFHLPVAFIICGVLLYSMVWFPYFKWWLDTRNWYGNQCGKAPKTEFGVHARWFPTTFETQG